MLSSNSNTKSIKPHQNISFLSDKKSTNDDEYISNDSTNIQNSYSTEISNQRHFFVDHKQICDFSFRNLDQLNTFINMNQIEKIDLYFKDFKQLSLFMNYFSGFVGYSKIKNIEDQNTLTNVLSFLLFRDIKLLQSCLTLAVNLLVGGVKRQFVPSKTQQLIAMRYFLQHFTAKWFDIKFSETESLPAIIFKNMSPLDDACYYIFINAIAEKIPPNSKHISDFIEILFNSPVNSPLQFKFVDDLTRKCPNNPPFYSILFFIKHSIDGVFTRISHHYLIPLLLDFYNQHEVFRITVWHYICRLVQFCITVECLNKQQKIMNDKIRSSKTLTYASSQPSRPIYNSLINSVIGQKSSANDVIFLQSPFRTDNSSSSETEVALNDSSSNDETTSSSSFDYFEGAFDDLDYYNNVVTLIIDLLHILYALHIPLLCRTVYMEIRCAQLGFNLFKKEKFDETYVILTLSEIKQSQLVELPKPRGQVSSVKVISTPDDPIFLQRQKELYYIQHYLYDKQLLKEFHRIRPREINLKKLLDFPMSEIPLKKGVKRPKLPPSKPKSNAKPKEFCCTTLAASLYGSTITKKSTFNPSTTSTTLDKIQNSEIAIRASPMIRLRQYFARESTSASAE